MADNREAPRAPEHNAPFTEAQLAQLRVLVNDAVRATVNDAMRETVPGLVDIAMRERRLKYGIVPLSAQSGE